MAVQYRLYQNNNSRSNQYKKWYARAVMIDTVDTDRLAEQIEANCTVKRADVLAVLSELVVVMKQELQNSKRVKLNSFGSFKLALTTGPASTAKEFSAAQNVKAVRVLFQPELRIDKNGKRTRTFVEGCKVTELPKNGVDTDEEGQEQTDTVTE